MSTNGENGKAVHNHAPGWGWCCMACSLEGPLAREESHLADAGEERPSWSSVQKRVPVMMFARPEVY